MFKLSRLKRRLRGLDGEVALWLSGGKDSRLLLEVLLDIGASFSILRFADGWSREQRRVIDELTIAHNLRVYTYRPNVGILVGDGAGEITLIKGYPVGSRGEPAMLFRDFVPGSKCAFDAVGPLAERIVTPPVKFDLHLVGTKRGETHWALNGHEFLQTKRWEIGDVDFFAPLYRWSDADVIKALREYGIEWQKPSDAMDTGNIAVCDACLHGVNEVFCPKADKAIPAYNWSPLDNLKAYRETAGIA